MNNLPILRVAMFLYYDEPAVRGFLRGISQYTTIYGPWMFYREFVNYTGQMSKKTRLKRLCNWKPNAIITHETGLFQDLKEMELPLIVFPFKLRITDHLHVIGDDIGVGKLAAKYFLNRGFEHFGFCGFKDMFWSEDTKKGFCHYVGKSGFEVEVYHQPRLKGLRMEGNEQPYLAEWLKSLPKPVAVLACVDERAHQLVEACREAELCVPDDVAILGVNNNELVCNLSNPPISSIVQNYEKAGYQLAELLVKKVSGQKITTNKVVFETSHVVTRQSTDILAIDDPLVVAAIRFIQGNVKYNIGVTDVAEELTVNRRTLERRFAKVRGISLYKEIRRAHVEMIIHLLLHTNHSIAQISRLCGYDSERHLSRNFRSETGMAALAYRKKYGLAVTASGSPKTFVGAKD